MRTNIVNFLMAGTLLLLVSGCFCQSDRENTDQPQRTTERSQTNTDEPPSQKKPADGKKTDSGDFIVEHIPVSNTRYEKIAQQVTEERLLEKAASKLNRALSLPADITLRTKDCDQVNAFYDPSDASVTMCFELMEHFYRSFKSIGASDEQAYAKMFDAVQFVFLHEIGHALIDQLNLPVAGNEEDAADRCSAYINIKELGDEGLNAVYAAADAFAIESKNSAGQQKNMADEHLLQEQRFYNSLCMIYGSDPEKHAGIVTKGYLPQERAVRCQMEYQRSVDSWINLLEPWRKN